MRVKITALTESPATIPFNYNYALHSAIYGLIEKSSGEYSRYLHDKGFINETIKKRFKLFTFSKLFFAPTRIQKNGFNRVKEITFIFFTPIEQSYEHLILGLFSNQTFYKTDYADHDNKHEFKFSFDVNYIAKRHGKISKLIHCKLAESWRDRQLVQRTGALILETLNLKDFLPSMKESKL